MSASSCARYHLYFKEETSAVADPEEIEDDEVVDEWEMDVNEL